MILAGDIGGTHTRLGFFDVANGLLRPSLVATFQSHEYSGLDEIVTKFVADSKLHADAACFGVAGPVLRGRVETPNLPWIIESKRLAQELRIASATVINDLEANAWGIAALEDKDLVSLNSPTSTTLGNQAVISAGTGLGEAGLYWDGMQFHVFASEGGHADFAPRNDLEIELLQYLGARFGHVSYERVVSGPGLANIFSFLRDTKRGTEPDWLPQEMEGDPAAAISQAAIQGRCSLCEQALDIFVSIYAAEAANLALKVKATAGVYLGGGIAPKILRKLTGPLFMQSFVSKGRMQALLESIPVKVINNESTALMGAARCAAESAGLTGHGL
jgi:glucokinase